MLFESVQWLYLCKQLTFANHLPCWERGDLVRFGLPV